MQRREGGQKVLPSLPASTPRHGSGGAHCGSDVTPDAERQSPGTRYGHTPNPRWSGEQITLQPETGPPDGRVRRIDERVLPIERYHRLQAPAADQELAGPEPNQVECAAVPARTALFPDRDRPGTGLTACRLMKYSSGVSALVPPSCSKPWLRRWLHTDGAAYRARSNPPGSITTTACSSQS